jgi:hypothetical protein
MALPVDEIAVVKYHEPLLGQSFHPPHGFGAQLFGKCTRQAMPSGNVGIALKNGGWRGTIDVEDVLESGRLLDALCTPPGCGI